jgi:GTP cyclohydrolase I
MSYNTLLILKENYMSANHDAIKTAYETYIAENEKFTQKGVKAAAARARKALQEMSKGIKERRKEITAEKEALAAAK